MITPVSKPKDFRSRTLHLMAETGAALLRCLPAETAHDVGMRLLESNPWRWLGAPLLDGSLSGLGVTVPGLGNLLHPIGLAAGFDKNGRCPEAFANMGFSFVEVGTVTPLPQTGNPKPRLFRLPGQRALINRMGFNNDGANAVYNRLAAKPWKHERVPLGVNVGKNKTTANELAVEDYISGLETFDRLAGYLVVNISSPNTEMLRDLANEHFLTHLAERKKNLLPKVWVKLDPDQPKAAFQKLIEALCHLGYQGVILSNTHKVKWPEAGGLSGHPLNLLATRALEWAWEVHRGGLPVIASGGILSGIDIVEKMARGAMAVQIYTALVYRGPFVVLSLLEEVMAEVRLRGLSCLSDVIGTHYQD